MADFILAAHIRVMGGDAAVAELRKVDQAMNQVGRSTGAGAGSGITAGLREAEKQSSVLAGSLSRVQDAMVRIATYTGITAIAAGFYQATQGVLDFNQAMTESLAIQRDVSSSTRGRMEDLAKSMAVDFGMAPGDVAEGFYFLASAGLNAEQQIAALPQVTAFAKAGMMELEAATELAYDALSALGMKVSDPQEQLANLTRLTDLLTQAAIDSQGTVEQFGEALANKAGASIKTFGIDLEEGIGLLEVFADQGVKGKVAGERFSMLIRDMALKALKNADSWKALGVEVYDASGSMNDLLPIMQQIDKALLPMTDVQRTEALKSMGFTLRDVQTILALLGTSDDLARFTGQLEAAGGAAQRVADNQMEALRAKLDQLKAFTVVLAIEGAEKFAEFAMWLSKTFAPAIDAAKEALSLIGEGARPAAEALLQIGGAAVVGSIRGVAGAVESVFSYFAEHEDAARQLGTALGLIGGGAVISQLANLGAAIYLNIVDRLRVAGLAVNEFFLRFAVMAQVEGKLAATRAAIQGIFSLLTSPFVLSTALMAGILAFKDALDDGKRKAQEFRQQIERQYDTSTISGVEGALKATADEYQRLAVRQDDSFAHRLKSGLDILAGPLYNTSDNFFTMSSRLRELGKAADEYNQRVAALRYGAKIIQEAFSNTGAVTGPQMPGGMEDRINKIGAAAQNMGLQVNTSIPALEAMARAAKIDMTAPMEDWAPALAEAALKAAQLGTQTGDLAAAIAAMGSEATTAAEKIKALDEAYAELMGTNKNLFDATTSMEQGIVGLKDSVAEFVKEGHDVATAFDATSKAGLANRQALSGLVDDYWEMAKAQGAAAYEAGTVSSATQGTVDALRGYRGHLIGLLESLGVPTAKAHELASELGLSVENLDKLDASQADVKIGSSQLDAIPPKLSEIEERLKQIQDPKWNLQIGISAPEVIGADVVGGERSIIFTVETPNLPEKQRELDEAAAPRTQATTVDTPNMPEVIGAMVELASPRTQETTVDTPNAAAKKDELDDVAQRRTAEIVAEALTSAARSALASLTGHQGSAYIDVWYIRRNTPQGGEAIGGQMAQGGILESYAGGGLKERHVAQIAPRGAWRLWAEPETGGEAYIPLAESKRGRSMAIWEEVGRRFGVGTGGGVAVNMHAPVSVSVAAAPGMDVSALAEAAGQQVASAVNQATSRLLVELRAR